jgi:hypothetical protein
MLVTKKPVSVEAFQWTGGPDQAEDPEWAVEAINDGRITLEPGPVLAIKTLEGVMRANPGDWIIKGVKGELYPCKDDIFRETYNLGIREPGQLYAMGSQWTEIESCARCGGNHSVVFKKLGQPLSTGQTHWAPCPATGEPIMMRIVEDDNKKRICNKEVEDGNTVAADGDNSQVHLSSAQGGPAEEV